MVAQPRAQAHTDTTPTTYTTIEAPPDYQTDPARITRLGVLCGRTLYAFRHTDPRAGTDPLLPVETAWELPGDYSLHDLGEAAALNKLGAVWLLPAHGARPSEEADHPLVDRFAYRAAKQLAEAGDDALLSWHPLTAGRPATLCGLVCQAKDERGRGFGTPIGLYAPWMGGKGGAWGFGGALGTLDTSRPDLRARTVATALALAAFTLGQQLRFSPGYTGGQLLRRVLAKKQQRTPIPALSEEWRTRLLDLLPRPFTWARAVDPTELERRDGSAVIFKYDRTSSYPASAGEVPTGDPTPTPFYQDRCPGVYRIDALAPEDWYESGAYVRLPGLFYDPNLGGYPLAVKQVWAWEPQIRLARQLGWSIITHHGYYWPRARVHDLFRPWRERVFAARLACAREGVPGRLAAAIVKLAGQATLGRLIQRGGEEVMDLETALAGGRTVLSVDVDRDGAFTGLVSVESEPGRTDLLWPHAWGTIIGNANERLQRAMCVVAPEDTIAGYVDALYTLRNHPELVGAPDGTPQLGRFRLDRIMLAGAGDLAAMGVQSAEMWVKTAAHLRTLAGFQEEVEAADGD